MTSSPPPRPAFLRRFVLPEVYSDAFSGSRALVVLRIVLLTAPVFLVLDWPRWGLTGVLLLGGLVYALLLVAYARAVSQLPGANPLSLPADPSARPYYAAVLAVAAALLLSPAAHLLRPSLRVRVGLGAGAALAILLALFLAQKVVRPGIVGKLFSQGMAPLAVAERAEELV